MYRKISNSELHNSIKNSLCALACVFGHDLFTASKSVQGWSDPQACRIQNSRARISVRVGVMLLIEVSTYFDKILAIGMFLNQYHNVCHNEDTRIRRSLT